MRLLETYDNHPRAKLVKQKMRELIREVNPKLFEEKYIRRKEFRADSWNKLCDMVTQTVSTICSDGVEFVSIACNE